jgi:hypothetical protein
VRNGRFNARLQQLFGFATKVSGLRRLIFLIMGVSKMKVLLVVPITAYNRLLSTCKPKDPEYLLLKNGLREIDGNGIQHVKILCDSDRARTIFDLAAKMSPEIVTSIRQITNLPDQLPLC